MTEKAVPDLLVTNSHHLQNIVTPMMAPADVEIWNRMENSEESVKNSYSRYWDYNIVIDNLYCRYAY